MSLKRTKGKEVRKSRAAASKVVAAKNVTKIGRGAAPKLAVKATLKAPAKTAIRLATKADAKPALTRPAIKAAAKLALKEAAPLKVAVAPKVERIHSHPTMCLHCHLIVEMFHERGADPVKGAWQCPRCGHKYLFSHWKIKRQARGKPEAA
jgi:DNA-directed RNA polymerase subunit RPC12/RpoP